MSTSSQTRDPALQEPCWLHPWQQPLPEFPDGDVPLSKALEVPVLPGPGSASPSAAPNPYDMSGGGGALAPPLSWAIGFQRPALGSDAPDPLRHAHSQIECNGVIVNVDSEIADIIELLNRSEISTLTSCCAEENGYGYVMFSLAASTRFLRFWERYMEPQGWELPALSSFELRDESWRAWMNKHYPPPVPFSVDEHGHTYTACWRFPSAQLAELRGPLCDALRQALRNSVGGRWSWATANRPARSRIHQS